jgi:hypothetical protein
MIMDQETDSSVAQSTPADSPFPERSPDGTAIAIVTADGETLPHQLLYPLPFGDADAVRRLIARTLDVVDGLADTIAEELGLRRL